MEKIQTRRERRLIIKRRKRREEREIEKRKDKLRRTDMDKGLISVSV